MSAVITASCKAGLLGEALKSVDPTIVGTVSVLTINIIKNAFPNAFPVAIRTENKNSAFGRACQRYVYFSLFVDWRWNFSGVHRSTGIRLYDWKFCLFNHRFFYLQYLDIKRLYHFAWIQAFTMFGLVEQDYTLPKEIIEQMGIETFDYETFQ